MTETPWHLQEYKKALASKGKVLPIVQAQLIKERLSSTRDTAHLHPSEIAKKDWCPRSSWYTIKGYEKEDEKFAFQRLNVFAEGHAIHAKWQGWLRDAGVLHGTWQCKSDICSHKWVGLSPQKCPSCGTPGPIYREVPVTNEQFHILGHADGIVNNGKEEPFLIEIKSVGAGTIRFENYDIFKESEGNPDEMWKRIRQPFQSHVRQAMLYMYCTGIHTMVFIYEWKATQEVKEFVVQFQQELVDPILSACETVVRALDSSVPPMRPAWVTDSEHKTCKQCPFKNTCWKENDANNTAPRTDDDSKTTTGRILSKGEVQSEIHDASTTSGGNATGTPISGRVIRR
jgi:CRISPR/Cas system-associated exonuclease Cas4 (RecB family)